MRLEHAPGVKPLVCIGLKEGLGGGGVKNGMSPLNTRWRMRAVFKPNNLCTSDKDFSILIPFGPFSSLLNFWSTEKKVRVLRA